MKKMSFDDPTTGPTAFYLTIGVILFAVAVFGLQGYYGRVIGQEAKEKKSTQSSGPAEQLRTEQLDRMTEYRWLDADTGAVAIPIDRAMDLVVEELARPPEAGL